MVKLRIKKREGEKVEILGDVADVHDILNTPLIVIGRDMTVEEIMQFRTEWDRVTNDSERRPLMLMDPDKDISVYEFETVEDDQE